MKTTVARIQKVKSTTANTEKIRCSTAKDDRKYIAAKVQRHNIKHQILQQKRRNKKYNSTYETPNLRHQIQNITAATIKNRDDGSKL